MVLPKPPPAEQVPVETPFARAIQEIAPPWLQDEDSVKLLFDFGLNIDCSLEYIRMGVLQRFPTAAVPGHPEAWMAQPAAVVATGRDRQISRGQFEPDASYRERVRAARTTWRYAGNADTLLGQIRAYFLPTPPLLRYVANGVTPDGTPFADWTTMLPDGTVQRRRAEPSNWDWDGTVGHVRFWVIIYSSLTPWFWGDASTPPGPPQTGLNWAGGQSWGYVESSAWLRDIRKIIAQWKSAGSHAGVISQALDSGIIAAVDDLAFDPSYPPGGVPGYPMPTGDWDDYTNRPDGGSGNPFLAVFLSGV